jgi:hypothetical protein
MNAQCVLRGKRSGLCARCVAERLRSGVGATERKRRDRPHLPARSCRGTFLTGTVRGDGGGDLESSLCRVMRWPWQCSQRGERGDRMRRAAPSAARASGSAGQPRKGARERSDQCGAGGAQRGVPTQPPVYARQRCDVDRARWVRIV